MDVHGLAEGNILTNETCVEVCTSYDSDGRLLQDLAVVHDRPSRYAVD